MARAKCKICGTELDTKTAYRITDKNGNNKYFCNQSEFEVDEACKKKAAEDKARVYRLICDVMGEQEIISTALFKEWQVWLKVADNEKIAKYLEENKDYLTSVITRLSSSEYAKIRYLSVVISNNIKSFAPKVEAEEKQKVVVDETIYNESASSTNKRRSLSDLEDMF